MNVIHIHECVINHEPSKKEWKNPGIQSLGYHLCNCGHEESTTTPIMYCSYSVKESKNVADKT